MAVAYGSSEDAAKSAVAPMRSLPPHPDVIPALTELRAAGFRLVTLTNSSKAAVADQIKHAGLSEFFEALPVVAGRGEELDPVQEPGPQARRPVRKAPGPPRPGNRGRLRRDVLEAAQRPRPGPPGRLISDRGGPARRPGFVLSGRITK